MSARALVEAYFDEPTNTVSYLVADPVTKRAVIIDPVLDYDQAAGRCGTQSAEAMLAAATEKGWRIAWILETHVHADHLSAAPFMKAKTGAPIGIGEHICEVQRTFSPMFQADDVSGKGTEFDHLFKDGEKLPLGELDIEVMHTPGHTPACVSYRIGDAVFVGDTMFMPDYGTARCDFPGGDAAKLYRSIRRVLQLPGETRLFMCHDYKTAERDTYAWQRTVAEQRASNVHIRDGVEEDVFVTMRRARDTGLPTPNLLLPAIQMNIRAGRTPPPASDGVCYQIGRAHV